MSIERRAYILILAMAVGACGGAAADANPKRADPAASATDTKSTTSGAPSAAPTQLTQQESPIPTSTGGLDLERQKGDGFEISVPKGSRILPQTASAGHTSVAYAYALDKANMNAIDVAVMGPDTYDSLEAFANHAAMVGIGDVATKKELNPGYLVVKTPSPSGTLQVVVWRPAPSGGFFVKCSGPAEHQAKLVDICSSLRASGK